MPTSVLPIARHHAVCRLAFSDHSDRDSALAEIYMELESKDPDWAKAWGWKALMGSRSRSKVCLFALKRTSGRLQCIIFQVACSRVVGPNTDTMAP